MDYAHFGSPPPSVAHHHHRLYSSPNTLQNKANLRSCLRQGNFSSNRSTRSASSYPQQHLQQQQQAQARGDDDDRTARSAPTTTGSVMSNENDERQFMKLSNTLVTEHKSGKYSSVQATRQLLHYYIPSARQRQMFLQSLRRNTAFLPMFPEPNEHPGYALTRYVDRVFRPLLEREDGDIHMTTSGPPSPTRVMQPTYSTSNYQTTQQQQQQQQPIHPSSTSAPTRDPPLPLDYNNNEFVMLFPPPSAARDEVSRPSDRVPPPIQPSPPSATVQHIPNPMTSPLANDSLRYKPERQIQQPQQQQQQHVSFPLFSPTDASIRDPQRHHLPRPHQAPTTPEQQQQQPSFTTPPPLQRPVSTIGDELNKNSHIQQYPSMNSKSLLNMSSETTGLDGGDSSTAMLHHHHQRQESTSQIQEALTNMSIGVTTATSAAPTNATSTKDDRRSINNTVTSTGYQKFTNSKMLPPITPRENILYNLPSRQGETSCCSNDLPIAKRKRPTYLQLYVKCERSEPYLQPSESMDIVTWYRNGNNEVTADRTLVVQGTTSLLDLIGGIIEAFGLFSDQSDACMKANSSSPLLMAYNDICFMSDVKVTTNERNETTALTPLPIPGFYYKYVDREVHGKSEMEKESVLSTDPVVLTRTLVAQVLDKPLYRSKQYRRQQQSSNNDGIGIRSRLALVYCAPKREAYVSPRTQRGVLPETIYHFQILLEGHVEEDD